MKPLLLMTIAIVAPLAGALAIVLFAGAHVKLIEPATAAVIAILSALFGLLPVLRASSKDLSAALQMAMVGTVIHLLTQSVLTISLLFAKVLDSHGAFVFWVLGGYLVSLFALIWQLRQRIIVIANDASRSTQHSASPLVSMNVKE